MKIKHKKKSIAAHKGLLLLCVLALCISGCARLNDEVINVEPAPLASASQKPAPSPDPTPRPSPSPKPDKLTAEEGVYTVAWISDTQHYSKKYPYIYYEMASFLSKERERLNIAYIVHTGDLVHNYNDEEQWKVADGAQAIIDDIPNGVCAGNHDVHYDDANYKYFGEYFGAERYEGKAWYGANYQNNRGHYDLVDIGGTPFIFVYMGYAPDSSSYKWLNSVFKEYPGRVGVLCVHDYFKTSLKRSETGEKLYKKVVKENPNLYMVLCGHRYNQAVVTDNFDDDGDGAKERNVYQMMNNYQAAEEGGSGYMRFLQIDTLKRELRVYSYSSLRGDYVYYDTEEARKEKYAADPAGEEYIIPLPWPANMQ